jgi:4-azaleucine resistance transporter AzlC
VSIRFSPTLRDSLSVSITVGAYGVAFGAAAVANGFSVLQACLLSLLTFSGASQFAVVGVIGSGGSAISAITTASLLGTRNALYGVIMAPRLRVKGLKRVLAAQITIDESTGVALGQEQRGDEAVQKGFWYTGIGVFVFWNLFTLAGALGAQAMGDVRSFGLDSAVPAAFLGLLWPRLTSASERFLAVTCAVFAVAMTPILPAGLPIIATAFIAIALGVRR